MAPLDIDRLRRANQEDNRRPNALRLWNAAAILTDLAAIAITTREAQIIVHTEPILADFTRLTVRKCRAFSEI